MKREDLEKLGLTKEQVDVIMDANGKDINEHKKLSETYKTELDKVSKEKTTVETEYSEFKKSKMTAEEKQAAEEVARKKQYDEALAAAEAAKKEAQTVVRRTKVREVFVTNGFAAEEADALVGTFLNAETDDVSVTNAKSFVDVVKKKNEAAAAAAVEAAARGTPPPAGKTPPPGTQKTVESVW